MKIVGLMLARNEDWCIGFTARVALLWVDHLVVLDHASTDRTFKTVAAAGCEPQNVGRVTVLREDSPRFDEMFYRQRMLGFAREAGATHIAIIDADEALTANLVGRIRAIAEELDDETLLCLPGFNLRNGLEKYHVTGVWADRHFACIFRDRRDLFWGGDRFHHRAPMTSSEELITEHVHPAFGGILHLWGTNELRLRAKHAWYKMTERLRWPDKPVSEIDRMYNAAFDPAVFPLYTQVWQYDPVPSTWWAGYGHLKGFLHLEQPPWQIFECKKMLCEHPPETFAGLDLFGVPQIP